MGGEVGVWVVRLGCGWGVGGEGGVWVVRVGCGW